MARPNRRSFILSTVAVGALCASGAVAKSRLPYQDVSRSISERVADLLSRMSLDEKLGQIMCVADARGMENGSGIFDPRKASQMFPNGIGHAASVGCYAGRDPDSPQRDPETMATYVNALQAWATTETRLGIPVLCHEEALHGHRARGATMFPQAIGLAASFDPDMITEIFGVAATEMRARGAFMALTPVLDVARDPRWGRVEETYGEDPHLCSEIGLAAVRGFQGDVLPLAKNKVIATLKHFVADAESVNGTNTGPAQMGERQLREVHLRPFELIIKSLPVRSVMVTYNEIDGLPCAANSWLLTNVLRQEWGFEGMVVADYNAIQELVSMHDRVPDKPAAAALALNAGVDVEMPDPQTYMFLKDKLASGDVTQARIDEAVSRVLRTKFEAGLFDSPFVDPKSVGRQINTPSSRALAVKAAERCPVLLKNQNNTLPLSANKTKRLLVVGNAAKDTPCGGYTGQPPYVVSVVDGLKAVGEFEVTYSEGVRVSDGHSWFADDIKWTPDSVNDALIRAASAAATNADAIVMVLGANEGIVREAWNAPHKGDRSNLDLMGRQNDLAEAMFATGKPVIAVLLNGAPLSVGRLAERADALLEAWYNGQETGTGIANILTGVANPGGKLPVSIPKNVGQIPVYYNRKPTARRSYVDGDTAPLYPFGFGLSFTTFEIGAPRLQDQAKVGLPINVEVDVTNSGSRDGDEVVQLYIHHPFASVTLPIKELKAFRRLHLKAGEKQTVKFTLGDQQLGCWNDDMHFVTEPGEYEIMAGNSSENLKSTHLRLV